MLTIKMDIQNFTELITPLREKLYRFALKMLGDNAEAEDNVQETFLRLWTMRLKIGQYQNFDGLAMQINKNLCLDKLRAKKDKTSIENIYNHTTGQNAHTSLETKQVIDLIEKIIASLPSLQQIIIRMRDVEGYEIDEIAALTVSRPEAVRVNLSRARRRIREQYFKLLDN
ncbi:MAG: RNA polymerase sigma factor [Prevotellaceae bacterium]|nr:RNA polymerase sigma factor [Prevotellaceae bacterium]